MIHPAFQARPGPGNDILADLASCLLDESLLASAMDSIRGVDRAQNSTSPPEGGWAHPELARLARLADERKPDTTTIALDRVSRNQAVMGLVGLLEERIGLTFRDTTVPIVALPSQAEKRDGPLAGYLGDHPDYGPSEWVLDLFARWDVHDGLIVKWRDRGLDDDTVRGNSESLETARLLRAALYHCWYARTSDATATAAAYVTDVAAAGLCRDVNGAGRAFAMLLRAGANAQEPESLVRLFYNRIPVDIAEWVHTPLHLPPDPQPLTATTMNAVSTLLSHAYALLDRARQAANFDEWFTMLTRAECLVRCVYYALQWAAPRLSLGLRTVQSQFGELDAHYGAINAVLTLSDMTAVVEMFRRLAAQFRATGDTAGDRFAREQLLIPRELLSHRDLLPQEWLGPSWRTASVVPHDKLPGSLLPQQALVMRPDVAAHWRALAAALGGQGARQAAEIADLMAGYLASGFRPALVRPARSAGACRGTLPGGGLRGRFTTRAIGEALTARLGLEWVITG